MPNFVGMASITETHVFKIEREIMTPRDKLIENIIDCVHATQNTPDHQRFPHLVRLLKTHYAIGRWVSVEDRLPEFDDDGHWHGIVMDNDGDQHSCLCLAGIKLSDTITHWLELNLPIKDMPSGKGKRDNSI